LDFRHGLLAADLLSIDTNYDAFDDQVPEESEDDSFVDFDEPSEEPTYLLSRIFPLRWFQRLDADDLRRSKSFMESIVGLQELGLSAADAQTFTNIVLQELVENVSRHAGEESGIACPPRALVGAIALGENYKLRTDSSYTCLGEAIGQVARRVNRSHPIIVLFVGDSGVGILPTLGPFFEPKHNSEIPKMAKVLTKEERVCLWSLMPWSTRERTAPRWDRGARGLWRVRRVLRSYGGFITVRSADVLVGWDYTANYVGAPVVEPKRLRHNIGTVIDCCILPGLARNPREFLNERKEPQSPQIEYDVVLLDSLTEEGLSAHDLEKLTDHAAHVTASAARCVVVILNIREIPSYWPAALEQLISTLSMIAITGSLVLVCPSIGSREIAVAAASLEAYHDQTSTSGTFPILFLDTYGEGQWLNANKDIRDILDSLFEGRKLNFLNLSQDYPSAKQLWDDLSQMPEVLWLNDQRYLRCLITPLGVFTAVGAYVARIIKEAVITPDHLTVFKGVFITPSLRHVSRWINLPALLEKLKLEAILGYLISGLIQRELYADNTSRVRLARIEGERIVFYADVADRLDTATTPLVITDRGYSVSPPHRSNRVEGGLVVILTDIVFTENTLRNAISELSILGHKNCAVVCVLDARAQKIERLTALGRTTRILSVAQVDIAAVPDLGSVPIDPILKLPIPEDTQFEDKALLDRSSLLIRWLRSNPQSLIFRHVIRNVGSHCCIYPNGGRLIGPTSTYKAHLVEHAIAEFSRWLVAEVGVSRPFKDLTLWLPTRVDYAEQLADGLVEALQSQGATIKREYIPREAYSGRWIFSRHVALDMMGQDILIVEWGAVTAKTIQEMARLALESGARSVFVLTILSQLSEEEQALLSRISTVLARRSASESTVEAPLFATKVYTDVPTQVKFHFVTRVRFGSFAPSECPVCRHAADLELAADTAPTDVLRKHAHRIIEALTPSEPKEALSKVNLDVYGSPITTEEVSKILMLRMLIEDSLRSTIVRLRLLEMLVSARSSEDIADARAIVRLLAAEPSWLDSPGLQIDLIREPIAQIARAVIEPRDSVVVERGVKMQALSLLRRASQSLFCEELPRLFALFIDDPLLSTHCLWEVHEMLHQCELQPGRDLPNVHLALELCRNRLPNDGTSLDFRFTVEGLRRQDEFIRQLQLHLDTSPRAAWRGLRIEYLIPLEKHISVVSSFNKVLSDLSLPTKVIQADAANIILRMVDNWNRCAWFLTASVFPYLPRLKTIVTSSYYMSILSPEERLLMHRLTTPVAPLALNTVNDLLNRFALRPADLADRELRRRCYAAVDAWGILALSKLTDADDPRGAKLMRIVKSCPSSIAEAIRSTASDFSKRSEKLASISNVRQAHEGTLFDDQLVFCDRTVLEATFAHIFENALADERRRDRAIPVDFKMLIRRPDPSRIQIVVVNTNTITSTIGGRGLETMREGLRAFGGDLSYGPTEEAPFTFEVTVTLVLWETK